ncbi:TetR family transcriptional regulator [Streptomyces sp. SID486]|uniref:TetR/AcrR family transcriptional regulator n=1 Tax=Streptomyces sp. SID486 TaxID=2690264 RepID=UPI001369A8D3|nr:TetR/AcrR family transcriptional regulator [Streptomyces sp. SID486]MYW15751.1 TetR family transcriptional regulator [Streptomyces sp. SID2955]MYX97455.1 TetR family transcriptional regulator [Streptomyces sp. SID486]
MTPPATRRPVGHHHGNLRNALLQASLELVGERGPHGFTLAEASRRAGVSVAAPYKHFTDRDALLAELATQGYREQRTRFAAAMNADEDPVEQLASFAAAYVRFAAEEPALFDVTFNAGLDKSRFAELASTGDEVAGLLLPVARQLAPTPDAAFDLLLRVAAAAHGLAVFLRQGLFGMGSAALTDTEKKAARTAREITGQVADLPERPSTAPTSGC